MSGNHRLKLILVPVGRYVAVAKKVVLLSSWIGGVNNPTFSEFCFSMIGRADIEGSKSSVAMNAWLPQAS